MKPTLGVLTALLCLAPATALAGPFGLQERAALDKTNAQIAGRIHDYTANHGEDRRVYSPALGCKRDLYVYTPPCFRHDQAYPFLIYLHGLNQDEQSFFEVVPLFDDGIQKGILPPCVIAVPDGTINGEAALFGSGSFYINSDAGRFEDWVMKDVWCFCFNRYPLHKTRCCHGLVGASMGGFGVYNLAIKYRNDVCVVAGILPALDLRYINCHGNPRRNFDPECYDRIERLRPFQSIACIGNIVPIPRYALVKPLFPIERETVLKLARESPVEMLDTYDVRPGQLQMFIGYAGKDDFNLDAHAESFIHRARQRGIPVEVVTVPNGKHRVSVGMEMGPAMIRFMGRNLRASCGCCGCEPAEDHAPTEGEIIAPEPQRPLRDPDPAPTPDDAALRSLELSDDELWVEVDSVPAARPAR